MLQNYLQIVPQSDRPIQRHFRQSDRFFVVQSLVLKFLPTNPTKRTVTIKILKISFKKYKCNSVFVINKMKQVHFPMLYFIFKIFIYLEMSLTFFSSVTEVSLVDFTKPRAQRSRSTGSELQSESGPLIPAPYMRFPFPFCFL